MSTIAYISQTVNDSNLHRQIHSSKKGISLNSHRNICTSLSRGCQSSLPDNVAVPQPAAWHSYTHLHHNTSDNSAQKSKIKESTLATDFWRANTGSIVIQTPSFRKINTTIGYTTDHNIPAILDPSLTASVIGDMVPNRISDVIGDNPESINGQPEYKARHIQKIRRWRMNRHKLKRLRRRMKMVYRRRNFEKKKKKEARLTAVMNAIRQDGAQFDALEFVKERLERSRRGGFVQDIWKPADEQPGVPWKDYTFPKRKIKTYEVKVKPPSFVTKKQMKELRKMNKQK